MSLSARRLAPLGVALIWGVNIPIMKAAIGVLHPFAFNALRLTLSVAALGWIDHRSRKGQAAPATPWRSVALVAALAGFLYQLLFIGGMGQTSAAHTSVLIGSSPIWTAILGRVTGQEVHRPAVWIGLCVAFLGTILVVSDTSGPSSLRGDAIVLGAAVAWAAGALISRRVLDTMSPLRLAYLYALIALPAHWLVAWPTFTWQEISSAPVGFWYAVLYAGVMSTGVAYALWNVGLLALGPARTTIYVNLVPVIAIFLAWSILGEEVGGLQLAGASLVIGGLLLVQLRRAARQEPVTSAPDKTAGQASGQAVGRTSGDELSPD